MRFIPQMNSSIQDVHVAGHNADIDDKCLQRKIQHYKFMSDWKYDLLKTIYRSRGEHATHYTIDVVRFR
jgi:uncharacterized protein (UPF0276 family)